MPKYGTIAVPCRAQVREARLKSAGEAVEMSSPDPIHEFEHTHGHLTKMVVALKGLLAAVVRKEQSATDAQKRFVELSDELREELLLHFAREEEGLFPYIRSHIPGQAGVLDRIEAAHDGICGAILRMTHLGYADFDKHLPAVIALFERLEKS